MEKDTTTDLALVNSGIARPEIVPWADLHHQQFGSDYADLRVFKFKVLKHLKTILPTVLIRAIPRGPVR